MNNKLVKMCCPICGSEDVVRDGTLAWSIEDQRWEAAGEYDTLWCNSETCEGAEFKAATEVELEGKKLDEYLAANGGAK